MQPPPHFHPVARSAVPVLRMRPAWASYWPAALAAVALVAFWILRRGSLDASGVAPAVPTGLSELWLVIALAPLVGGVLWHRYTRSYEIEGGRTLRATRGFVARNVRAVTISKAVHVDLSQSVAGRLLNYGTIAFWSGDDQSRLAWVAAADPVRTLSFVESLKDAGDRVGASDGSPAAPASRGASRVAAEGRRGTAPTLKDAKKTKGTGFGSGSFKTLQEIVAKRVTTPLGHYIDNDDGTVTHEESGLMWIRAPWGMVWHGDGFEGEPITLGWADAARLFGKGVAVPYAVGGTMAHMGREKLAASAFTHGYERGGCTVRFAGYPDWRLPTAIELDTMGAYARVYPRGSADNDPSLELSDDERRDWAWRGRANTALMRRLFPELSRSMPHLWTATGLGDGLAWGFDGSFPPGDHEIDRQMAVVFVRDRAAGRDLTHMTKLVDEALVVDPA